MNFLKFSATLLAFATSSLLVAGCKDDDVKPADPPPPVTPTTSTLDLEFENMVGNDELQLETQHYTTSQGDDFTVKRLTYYISNVQLTKTDGTVYAPANSYYLVDAATAASNHLALKDVPTGDYNKLTFTVGVDSARNVSGAQTGALTPGDMFWTWNSGYVFMKLEGRSSQAKDGAYLFHIGGFRSPNNTIRTVSPALPGGTNIQVRADHSPEVHIKADVLRAFSGPNPIRLADTYNVMGGANAVRMANNYAAASNGMFSIEHIHAN